MKNQNKSLTKPDEKKRRILKPFDLLILVPLLLALALFTLRHSDNNGLTAYIYKDGSLLYEVSLSQEREYREIQIDGEYPAVIAVENGTIRYLRASCPDKLCVDFGTLSENGDFAACIPAGTYIRVSGGSSTADAVTG